MKVHSLERQRRYGSESYRKDFGFWAFKHRTIMNRGPCPGCGNKTRGLWRNGVQRSKGNKVRYRCHVCGRTFLVENLAPIKPIVEKDLEGLNLEGNIWESEQPGDVYPFTWEEEQAMMNEDRRPEGLKRWAHKHGRR